MCARGGQQWMCGSCMGTRGGVIQGESGGRAPKRCSKRMAGPFFIVAVLAIACTGTKDEVSLSGTLSLSPAPPVPVSSPPLPFPSCPGASACRAACVTPYPNPSLTPPLLLCPCSLSYLVHLVYRSFLGAHLLGAHGARPSCALRCTAH